MYELIGRILDNNNFFIPFYCNSIFCAICVVDRKVATKHHEHRKFYFLVVVFYQNIDECDREAWNGKIFRGSSRF
jgi:hypothetical protein